MFFFNVAFRQYHFKSVSSNFYTFYKSTWKLLMSFLWQKLATRFFNALNNLLHIFQGSNLKSNIV